MIRRGSNGEASFAPRKAARWKRTRWRISWWPALILGVAFPSSVTGQLISPGKLSEAHAHLEGMGNCTQCHQLRTRGVDAARCLGCHEALAKRIREKRGYHGSLPEPECGLCHKEHLGKSFESAHFLPENFAHDSTGFALRGRHDVAECASCHQPGFVVDSEVRDFKAAAGALDRTFLGLPTDCGGCHGVDDPHAGQFREEDCGACHDEREWAGATGFDHSRSAFPLEGAHREVECEGCHAPEGGDGVREFIRYRPVEAGACRSCHEDPHEGRMKGTCEGCHQTSGWMRVRGSRVEASFDHGGTSFPLAGAHEEAACRSCHSRDPGIRGLRLTFPRGELGSRSYPRPIHETCASCHRDPHDGSAGEGACDTCHGAAGWAPASFDLARHNEESSFLLTGAHGVTPCLACHEPGGEAGTDVSFRVEGFRDCASCHRVDDPHEGAFGDSSCRSCHDTSSFQMERFDHERPELRDLVVRCTTCHGDDQPHGNQFPSRECGQCHSTDEFEIPSFDHSEVRFQLDGAHRDLACGDCHRREPDPQNPGRSLVRYRPLESDCSACHGGGL